jgi:hypothetical protein
MYDKSEMFKAFSNAFKEKFVKEFPVMTIIDIIPLIRVQYRGPALKNSVIQTHFESFMSDHAKDYEDISNFF